MSFSREEFLKPSLNGVWCSEVRSVNELSSSEIARRAVANIPGVLSEWHNICMPFINSEPDYETMEEQNSEEWVYSVHSWLDLIYDQLPLKGASTTVYRLQTPDGEGVFSHGVGLRALVAPENGSPQDDPKIERFVRLVGRSLPQNYQKSWFFGCQDVEQMKNWLNTADLHALYDRRIEIAVYEISEQWCIHGNQQSIFQKERARMTNQLSVNEILNETNIHSVKFKR